MAAIRLWLEVEADEHHLNKDWIGELRVGKIRRKMPSSQVRAESKSVWMEVAIHFEDMAYFRDNNIIRLEIDDASEVITSW
jgi:hypothetical protein